MGDAEEADYEIWPRNTTTVQVFLALATQWRAAPMGGPPTGRDYAAITPLVLSGLSVGESEWPGVFAGLRVMEQSALSAFAEQERKRATAPRRGH